MFRSVASLLALAGSLVLLPSCAGQLAALRGDPALLHRIEGEPSQPILTAILTGQPGAGKRAEHWLKSNTAASGANRGAVFSLLCEDRFRASDYARAIEFCRQADAATGSPATRSLQMLLEPLKDSPPPRWTTAGATIALFKDGDGVRRLHVGPADNRIEAVLDTGAEISVVMASVARQLGVRGAGGATLETTTTPITGSIGVIDRLEIDGTILLDLPVVILPDEQLRFPDGGSIPFVLGLPALIQANRFAVTGHGTKLRIGTDARLPTGQASAPLYWDKSGFGMAVRFASGTRAAHFDSGSGRTYLYPSALTALSRAELASRHEFGRTISGLGGSRQERASRLGSVHLRIAGRHWLLVPIEVAERDENREAARIGAALFDRFETVTVDFVSMRMWLDD